jgi:hypothetical protein
MGIRFPAAVDEMIMHSLRACIISLAAMLLSIASFGEQQIEFGSLRHQYRYLPATDQYQVRVKLRDTPSGLAQEFYGSSALKIGPQERATLQEGEWVDLSWSKVKPEVQQTILDSKSATLTQQQFAAPTTSVATSPAIPAAQPQSPSTKQEAMRAAPAAPAVAITALWRKLDRLQQAIEAERAAANLRSWRVAGTFLVLAFAFFVFAATLNNVIGAVKRLLARFRRKSVATDTKPGGILPQPVTAAELEAVRASLAGQLETLAATVAVFPRVPSNEQIEQVVRSAVEAAIEAKLGSGSSGGGEEEQIEELTLLSEMSLTIGEAPFEDIVIPPKPVSLIASRDALLDAWYEAEQSAGREAERYYEVFLSRLGTALAEFRVEGNSIVAGTDKTPIDRILLLEGGKFFAVLPARTADYFVYPRGSQFSEGRDYRARFEKLFAWPSVPVAERGIRVVEPAVVPCRFLDASGVEFLDNWNVQRGKVEVS